MRAVTCFLVAVALLAGCGDETTINNYYLSSSGAITGRISPADAGTRVMTADNVRETLVDANGFFLLDSLAAGVYHLIIRPVHYSRREFDGIPLVSGQVQSLGDIKLSNHPYPIFQTKPSDGEDSVRVNPTITLYADEPLNLEDLKAGTSITPPVLGTWQDSRGIQNDSKQIIVRPIPDVVTSPPVTEATGASSLTLSAKASVYFFVPSEPLRLNTTYHVRISPSVRMQDGDSLGSAVSFQFTTEPLSLTLQRLGEGIMGGVPLWGFNPTIISNELVDVDSLAKAVSFTPLIEGIWVEVGTGYRGGYYEFMPTLGVPLLPQTDYTMIMADDVTLAGGLRLQKPDTIRFTTEPYGVTDAYPPNGSRVYNPFRTIGISFNAAMDSVSVQSAFSMRDVAADTVVTGYFRWALGERRIAFDISGDLRTGAVYRYTLSHSARTASGQALTQDFTAVFAVE